MADQSRLPVKVVIVAKKDVIRPERPPGGGTTFFVKPDEIEPLRAELLSQIDTVSTFVAKSVAAAGNVPAVGKVTLLRQAIAKSHRPRAIFNDKTCPVIGGGTGGELLIGVTPSALDKLRNRVRGVRKGKALAALTTVASIEPYTADDAAGIAGVKGLQKYVSEQRNVLRCELFSHGKGDNKRIADAFLAQVARSRAAAEPLHPKHPDGIYKVSKLSPAATAEIAAFPGTRTVSPFPIYNVEQASGMSALPLTDAECPAPKRGHEYPIVGVIDTAVANVGPLEPWIVGRKSIVAARDSVTSHGTFVAGLVAAPHTLNNTDGRFPVVSSRVLSIEALDRNGISEERLEAVIEQMVIEHPEVRVWNLSLQTNDRCVDHEFSGLSHFLDQLADEHDVIFVIAAGNIGAKHLRPWPRTGTITEEDRICRPADCVRGITVGSLASLDNKTTLVRKESPSPFSRRGPGPASTPKPEVVHYGGNCDRHAKCDGVGVRSVSPDGKIAESMGTSFSTPIVSSLVANLDALIDMPVSRPLARALLVHSAQLDRESSKEDAPYSGFGRPGTMARLLNCSPHEATLIFEPVLKYGQVFEKNPFPIPPCMRTDEGKFRGEIIATIAFDPPVNKLWGAEYCRTEVEFSMGIWEKNEKGVYNQTGKVPPLPTKPDEMREEHLIRERFKWSPIRVHRKAFARGTQGDVWRLAATLLLRDNAEANSIPPQRVAIIVTLRGVDGSVPVHKEMTEVMAKQNWLVNDLAIRAQARVRVR